MAMHAAVLAILYRRWDRGGPPSLPDCCRIGEAA